MIITVHSYRLSCKIKYFKIIGLDTIYKMEIVHGNEVLNMYLLSEKIYVIQL